MTVVSGLSRSTKVLLVGIVLLVALALSGLLRADNDVVITSEEAVVIAETQLDFEPENTSVRLLRQGVGLRPVWAVSFSIPSVDGQREFEELLVVEINADDGEIVKTTRN